MSYFTCLKRNMIHHTFCISHICIWIMTDITLIYIRYRLFHPACLSLLTVRPVSVMVRRLPAKGNDSHFAQSRDDFFKQSIMLFHVFYFRYFLVFRKNLRFNLFFLWWIIFILYSTNIDRVVCVILIEIRILFLKFRTCDET